MSLEKTEEPPMTTKPDLSKAADIMKNLTPKKAEVATDSKPAPQGGKSPMPKVKASTKPAGNAGGAAHTRSSNRGK
jgi:hypothetical protein